MGFLSSIGNAVSGLVGSVTGGDLLSAGTSILGGFMSGSGQEKANAASAASTKEQMDFQERMSNTGYQRAVKDLQAADLNPMLAYSNGPASTPGGSSFQSQNVGDARARGMTAGATAAQTIANIDNTRSQTALNTATAAKAKADTASTIAELPKKQIKSDFYKTVGKPVSDVAGTIRDLYDNSGARSSAASSARSWIQRHYDANFGPGPALPQDTLQPFKKSFH